MTLSTRDRFTHPTSADVMAVLNMDHCEDCEGWATGLQPWWSDPNTVQGAEQLDVIGAHVLEYYGKRYRCTICGDLITVLAPYGVSHDLETGGDYDHHPVKATASL